MTVGPAGDQGWSALANLVVRTAALHDAGFSSAHRPGDPAAGQQPRSCPARSTGLPVTTAVRSSTPLDLSGALTEVQREAHSEGHDVYVSVHSRRGHPVATPS